MNRTAPVIALLALLAAPTSTLAGGTPALASANLPAGSALADQPIESVVVTGTGEVSGVPDVLTANFGVETTAGAVTEALDRANAAATRVRDALIKAGVAKADLQTSDVTISTRRNDKDKIIGYAVSQGLTAKIRNLSTAGRSITTAVTAGGDAARLNGVTFAIDDDTALLAEARRKAFADARAKAELYARESGRSLSRVVKVTEATPSYQPFKSYDSLAAAADSATPIEPGRQQLSVTVTVEWAFVASTS
ncbi:SIMPL domain-containing protein [Actinoplanes sp. NPDC023714]|uniref:SIMPL domain-containing protein n=1 Tax=Actinoplanes sp. NPDC023714 TaxID=3154322 RepID=UPI0033E8133A